MKKLLFTFDYELFLGKRSGSVRKCLIDPTIKMQQLLRAHGMLAVFFIDTTYLLRLETLARTNEKAAEDLGLIKHQLQQLAREGHYLYPHIHPHWLDAIYVEKENLWNLSSIARYRFHMISPAEQEMLFSESLRLLSEILLGSGITQKLDAYRAGGWCIQPFEDFAPFFRQYGIKYDFSVLKGDTCDSALRYFDFSGAATLPDIYHFSSDVAIQDPEGPFTELCITMLDHPSLLEDFGNRLFLRALPNKSKLTYGDGISADINNANFDGQIDDMPVTIKREMVSVELLTSINLWRYLDHLKHHDYMQFISHPKMLSPHNFESFDLFLTKIRSRYIIESDFKKICR